MEIHSAVCATEFVSCFSALELLVVSGVVIGLYVLLLWVLITK
jgi:hypothetical protein